MSAGVFKGQKRSSDHLYVEFQALLGYMMWVLENSGRIRCVLTQSVFPVLIFMHFYHDNNGMLAFSPNRMV